MLRLAFEGGRHLEHLAFAARRKTLDSLDGQLARSQRARLVERHDVHVGEPLDSGPAPKEYPVAGPAGDRRQDCGRD